MSDDNVAVFWDYENCELPSGANGYNVASGITRIAHQYGIVKVFKAYTETSEQTSLRSLTARSELTSCGVSIIDCPHNGRKDVADKMLIVDMLAYAMDTPAPATIVLISGDRDFVHALALLRLRKYRVVVIAPRNAVHASLKSQAADLYDWCEDVVPALATRARGMSLGGRSINEPRLPVMSAAVDRLATNSHLLRPTAANFTPTMSTAGNGDVNGHLLHHRRASAPSGITPDVRCKPSLDSNTSLLPAQEDLHITSFSTPDSSTNSLSLVSTPSEAIMTSSRSTTPSAYQSNSSPLQRPASSIPEFIQVSSAEPSLNAGEPVDSTSATFSPKVAPSLPSSSSNYVQETEASPTVRETAVVTTETRTAETTQLDIVVPTVKMYRLKRPHTKFRPLVKILECQRLEGNTRVSSSVLGTLVIQETPNTYQYAGVSKLKEYINLAEREGVVIVGHDEADGNRWTALHPAFHGGPKPPQQPALLV